MWELDDRGDVAVGRYTPLVGTDRALVWTSWGGGLDAETLFAHFGFVPDPAAPLRDLLAVSGDGLTFLASSGTGFSPIRTWVRLPASWQDLGGAGPAGPELRGLGYLHPGAPAGLALEGAAPQATGWVAAALQSAPLPLLGGVLHASPLDLLLPLQTDSQGRWEAPFAWPAGAPAGTQLTLQVATLDAAGPGGLALSNAVQATGW